MQYSFGSGMLFGVRTDTTPNTPVKFGVLQDVSLDFSFTEKELRGQGSFALEIARASGKITAKAKFAQIFANAFNSLFFGVASTTGQVLMAISEAGTIPTTPFQITVTNSATFQDDLGVFKAGVPMTKVASGPTTGQYSVATGVYTFAAADTGLAVSISYTYTGATGFKATVTNASMGAPPTFSAWLQGIYNSKQLVVKLPRCSSSKISLATKLEDWMIPEMDFSAMDDGSGNVAYWNYAE